MKKGSLSFPIIALSIILLGTGVAVLQSDVLMSPVSEEGISEKSQSHNPTCVGAEECNIPPQQSADLNQDGKIDFFDYYIVDDGFDVYDQRGDLNNDNTITEEDMNIFLSRFTGRGGCDQYSIPNEIGECTEIICRQDRPIDNQVQELVIKNNGVTERIQVLGTPRGVVSTFNPETKELILMTGDKRKIIYLQSQIDLQDQKTTNQLENKRIVDFTKPTRYIVKLKEDSIGEKIVKGTDSNQLLAHGQEIERKQSELKNSIKKISRQAQIKGSVKNTLNAIMVEDLSISQVNEIKRNILVENVYEDREVNAFLSESVPHINAPQVWQLPSPNGGQLTGTGIKIAVIDTGVDYNHEDLGSCLGENCKVIGGYDFSNYDEDPMDDHGHGTHVAATAAGNGALKGVAPDAKILAYKVLDASGSGYLSTVISGIERAVDPNQDGNFSDRADIISMSLGGPGDPDDPLSQAVDGATAIGTLSVIAAGNDGHDGVPFSIGSPGTARTALTVGAADNNDVLAGFSSRGPVQAEESFLIKPDVVAPGVDICAAVSENHASYLDNYLCLDNNHIRISGTSMATPHVSGQAALLKQKYPNLSPAQMKLLISQRAIPEITNSIPDPINSLDRGSGRIDALLTINDLYNGSILILNQSVIANPNEQQNTPIKIHTVRIPGMGASQIGLEIESIDYKSINYQTIGEFALSGSPESRRYCLEANSSDIIINANLAMPEYGIYSSSINYKLYQGCNFNNAHNKFKLPLLVYKAGSFNFSYENTESIGTYPSLMGLSLRCLDKNGLFLIIRSDRWFQEVGTIYNKKMHIFQSLSEYQRCYVSAREFEASTDKTKSIYTAADFTPQVTLSDVGIVQEPVFEQIKQDISLKKEKKVSVVLISGFYEGINHLPSHCYEWDASVYQNQHPDATRNVLYSITANKEKINYFVDSKKNYIAKPEQGLPLESETISKKVYLYNPTNSNPAQVTLEIFNLVDGGTLYDPTINLPMPFPKKLKSIIFNNAVEDPNINGDIIVIAILGFVNEQIEGTLEEGFRFFDSEENLMEKVKINPQVINGEVFYSPLFDINTAAEIFLGDNNIGEISVTDPNNQISESTGIIYFKCSNPQYSNPPLSECVNGLYKFRYDYSEELNITNSSGECLVINDNGILTINSCTSSSTQPDTSPPEITDIEFSPTTVPILQQVIINATVIDNVQVESVVINFQHTTSSYNFTSPMNFNQGRYLYGIAGFSSPAEYNIKIIATDTSQNIREEEVGVLTVTP